MTYDAIVDAITAKVRRISINSTPMEERYQYWYVGITHDVNKRKAEHEGEGEKTSGWESWTAVDMDTALRVEKHFMDLGMRPGEQRYNRDYNQNKVYVF